MHLTLGSLRVFKPFLRFSLFSVDGVPPSAPAQVTHPVGWHISKYQSITLNMRDRMKTICKAILLSLLIITFSSCNTSTAGAAETSSPLVDMSSLVGWGQSNATQNVNDFTLSLAKGEKGTAIQISYNLERGGWVSIWKTVDSQMLSNTGGISLYYRGSGASNTIELKLRLLYPGDTEETYFYASRHISTNTGGRWKLLKVPYGSFSCQHPVSQCADHQTGFFRSLDPTKVVKIDLAITNKGNDKVGSGTVTFDNIVGLSKFAAMMTVDNILKLLGIICLIPMLGFMIWHFLFGKPPWEDVKIGPR